MPYGIEIFKHSTAVEHLVGLELEWLGGGESSGQPERVYRFICFCMPEFELI